MNRKKLLIAEDQQLISAGLSALINTVDSFDIVGNVSDGQECVSFLNSNEVDIVLLDHQMPNLNGFETLKRIRNQNFSVKVILLTFLAQEALLRAYIQVGLDGCLLKHDTAPNLLHGLEQVANGEVYFSTSVAQVLAGQPVSDITPQVGSKNLLNDLTKAERQVLAMIGRGLSMKEISEKRGTAIKTVSHQKQQIMDKLNIHKETKLMKFTMDHGIL